MDDVRRFLEFVGFAFGALLGLTVLGMGGYACARGLDQFRDEQVWGGYRVVAGQTYDAYRASHPRWKGSSRTGGKARVSSEGKRCTGNPYAAPAAAKYGVPVTLIECVHYAESRCRADESIQGKHAAYQAVGKLAKPGVQRAHLAKIARHLNVPVSSLRSNGCGAMGPFQMIPSTWNSNARDGNGDGIASPYSLADSTYAASHMLAKVKAKKGTWRAAVKRYNANPSYVAKVSACAGI